MVKMSRRRSKICKKLSKRSRKRSRTVLSHHSSTSKLTKGHRTSSPQYLRDAPTSLIQAVHHLILSWSVYPGSDLAQKARSMPISRLYLISRCIQIRPQIRMVLNCSKGLMHQVQVLNGSISSRQHRSLKYSMQTPGASDHTRRTAAHA